MRRATRRARRVRDEDYLILSTIHSAKGQEWSSVFLLNCVDGCIPSDLAAGTSEEIEEERRLLYVAMTRAKDELDLIVPQRFYVHQQSRERRPPPLCVAHPLHPGRAAAFLRAGHLAGTPGGTAYGRYCRDADRRRSKAAGAVAVMLDRSPD